VTKIDIRHTRATDIPGIVELCRAVYPGSQPWAPEQLRTHLEVFPEGQWVATTGDRVVGMSASLVIHWNDYAADQPWRDFTAQGTFRNHDPEKGRTLYGAEVMVHPDFRGLRIGSRLYAERRRLAEERGIRRIRAGARLRGYHRYADELTPEEYVARVVQGGLFDPTLSFQLREGFRVLWLVRGYLRNDPESLGHAACIEWLNRAFTVPQDIGGGDAASPSLHGGPPTN
jgi:ribosomal protein S18 acetylase RimI-like enzyme